MPSTRYCSSGFFIATVPLGSPVSLHVREFGEVAAGAAGNTIIAESNGFCFI